MKGEIISDRILIVVSLFLRCDLNEDYKNVSYWVLDGLVNHWMLYVILISKF
jgi:hypothetical protein